MKKKYNYLFPVILIILIAFALVNKSAAQSGPENNDPVLNQGTKTKAVYGTPIPYRPGRRVSLSSSSPVAVVGSDQLTQSYITALPAITRTVNYTTAGVPANVTTRLNLRGAGNLNDANLSSYINGTTYGYNPDRNMYHTQTVIWDQGNIPLYALERIEVLKGPQGTLFGRNSVAGTVNLTSREQLDGRFTNGQYYPYYADKLDQLDYSNLVNNNITNWRNTVDAIKLKGEYNEQLPDVTFGPGGTVTITIVPNDDFLIQQYIRMDANNIQRQKIDIEWYTNDYYNSIRQDDYNCEGQLLNTDLKFTGQYGYEFNQYTEAYKNGQPQFGYFEPAPGADPALRQYLDIPADIFRLNSTLPDEFLKKKLFYNYNYVPDTDPCEKKDEDAGFTDDVITFGISLRLEDFGYEKKAFVGPTASYTHFFNPTVGATVDATLNFGKVNDTKYTIGSFYAGPTFIPFKSSLGLDNSFTLSAHTLAGYNTVSQKFNNTSNSYGNLSLKLGLAGDINLQNNLGVRLGFDDFMVLGKGNTTNNLGFSLGLRMGFK